MGKKYERIILDKRKTVDVAASEGWCTTAG